MAAALVECTKEEQQNMVRFLWSEGVESSKIYGRLSHQYDETCMNERKV
jgi:hypothetical protein